MKRCTGCKRILSEIFFHKCKAHRDGLKSRCKECANRETRRYYQKHAEALREKRRVYYQEHREEENRKARIRSNEYYQKNKKKILEKQREHNKKPDVRTRNRQYKAKWRKKNPEYDKKYSKTPSGKEAKRKVGKKRKAARRKMKLSPLIILDNFPVDCQDHHVHDWFIVSLPYITHNFVTGYPRTKHRELANVWIEKLYGIDISSLLFP